LPVWFNLPVSNDPVIPVNDLSRAIGAQRAQIDRAVAEVLDSGWVVLGPQVDRFESALAETVGAEHVVGLANGTDALTIALKTLGCGPGDQVVTVANAGGYATTAIRDVGAEPLYVDVDARTGLLDPSLLPAALAQDPAAVVVTHLFGSLADLDPIVASCRAAGVPLVEDCAQAIGARRGGTAAGATADVSAFSFYPTKNLGALGDGGALVTSDEEIAVAARSLRQYGWGQKYRAERPGGQNSRLDELQAAVLNVRLPLLEADNTRRRAIAEHYAQAGSLEVVRSGDDESYVAHLAVVRTADRERVRAHLEGLGIRTDVHYPVPDHRQAIAGAGLPALPVTELLAEEVLTLPCFPELTDDEVARVGHALGSL
jgi:dTDP-4-amino-4,6-dideoxygalactose transaminase